MHGTPRHLRATITRTDDPGDGPDTIDEENLAGWTVAELAWSLRRRYGPTVKVEVDADGQRYEITGTVIRAL